MSGMRRLALFIVVALCFPGAVWAADGKADPARPVPKLTAAQIVEKNIVARGGLQAWDGLGAMSWNGKMDAGFADATARSQRYVSSAVVRGGSKMERSALRAADADSKAASDKQVELPFLLEMKRPGKSRIEIEFAGKTAVQVYDGKEGWLKRPYLNRDDWEPFSPEQAKASAGNWDLEGPLLNYAAKGTKVELESMEAVEGHDAFKLKLTLKSGEVHHVWIDAQSFLDVKVEGTPRRMDGKMRTVWVYQRDFRSVQGLMVPFVQETAVDGYPDTHKMTLKKVGLNPQLDDALFVKPKS
jgi:hypothetical protein